MIKKSGLDIGGMITGKKIKNYSYPDILPTTEIF